MWALLSPCRMSRSQWHALSTLPPSQVDHSQNLPLISPELGLLGEHHQINASLSVQVCRAWLQEKGKWNRMNSKCMLDVQ